MRLLQHLTVLQVGELAVHQAVHGNEHPAAFLQRLGVDGDSRLVGGGAEDIECDGEAEGLVDEGLDGGLASHQPLQAGGGGVVIV